jgi:hypothetical protein
MFKNTFVFVLFWGAVSFGIVAFRRLANKEKWLLSKVIAYGAITATITAAILAALVYAF